mmetsp:Transcript_23218/g.57006  ORF Transcript_23218/g.57006 Transcript_23218/m.57006 type:complete len:274 (-) Transcript_23218:142-963(-)
MNRRRTTSPKHDTTLTCLLHRHLTGGGGGCVRVVTVLLLPARGPLVCTTLGVLLHGVGVGVHPAAPGLVEGGPALLLDALEGVGAPVHLDVHAHGACQRLLEPAAPRPLPPALLNEHARRHLPHLVAQHKVELAHRLGLGAVLGAALHDEPQLAVLLGARLVAVDGQRAEALVVRGPPVHGNLSQPVAPVALLVYAEVQPVVQRGPLDVDDAVPEARAGLHLLGGRQVLEDLRGVRAVGDPRPHDAQGDQAGLRVLAVEIQNLAHGVVGQVVV